MTGAQLVPDLFRTSCLALVGETITNSDFESGGSRDHFVNHPFEIAPHRLAAAVLLLELARRDSLDSIARLIVTRNEVHDDAIRAQPLVSAIKADDLAEVRRLINAGSAVKRAPADGGRPDDDYTPLAVTAREGHADIVCALLEAGADLLKRIEVKS